MARYKNVPPPNFTCSYEHHCPHLEGLSTQWVWSEYQRSYIRDWERYHIIDVQDKELKEAHALIQKLKQENEQLKAKLHALHRRQFKANKRKTEPAGANRNQKNAGTKKRGAPLGHSGWFRPEPEQVDQTVQVPAPEVCPHCQSHELTFVEKTKEHVQEDIDLRPKTVVTRFIHRQAYCNTCNQIIIKAADNELAGAQIGPVTKSAATYFRYRMGLSYRNIQLLFEEFFGLKFVPASALGFDRKAAIKGETLYEDLREKIKASPFLHADETGWRNDGINHFLWYVGNPDLAFFHIDRHRSSAVACDLIGKQFDGVLISDGYAAYNPITTRARQACLAHLIRNAKEIAEQIGLLKRAGHHEKQALRFCEKMIKLFKKACHYGTLIRANNSIIKQLPELKQDLLNQICKICQSPLQYQPAEKFRKRILKKELDRLFTFLSNPDIQPTNNHAEQSLRTPVIHRKIMFGNRSDEGIRTYSILSSLIHTAKRQRQHPRNFLETLLLADTAKAQAVLYNDSS